MPKKKKTSYLFCPAQTQTSPLLQDTVERFLKHFNYVDKQGKRKIHRWHHQALSQTKISAANELISALKQLKDSLGQYHFELCIDIFVALVGHAQETVAQARFLHGGIIADRNNPKKKLNRYWQPISASEFENAIKKALKAVYAHCPSQAAWMPLLRLRFQAIAALEPGVLMLVNEGVDCSILSRQFHHRHALRHYAEQNIKLPFKCCPYEQVDIEAIKTAGL